MNYIHSSFLNFVSKNLRNLDLLNVPQIRSVDFIDEINFGRIKKFKIDHVIGGLNLTFEEIHEFHCDPHKFFNWLNFTEKHKELKKLFLKSGRIISNNDIRLLARKVQHLNEASFTCNSFVDLRNLVKFLKNSKNLLKLHISDDTFSIEQMNALIKIVENEWSYVKEKQEFLIVRK